MWFADLLYSMESLVPHIGNIDRVQDLRIMFLRYQSGAVVGSGAVKPHFSGSVRGCGVHSCCPSSREQPPALAGRMRRSHSDAGKIREGGTSKTA